MAPLRRACDNAPLSEQPAAVKRFSKQLRETCPVPFIEQTLLAAAAAAGDPGAGGGGHAPVSRTIFAGEQFNWLSVGYFTLPSAFTGTPRPVDLQNEHFP